MESPLLDPRPTAAESLRRAIRETAALGHHGISQELQGLLDRVNAEPERTVSIEVCSGTVIVRGVPVKLSNRELELCLALATHSRPVPGELLAELLYPGLPADTALGRIKVYLHRVREKTSSDFIICDRDGYRFNAFVRIDLSEFEEIMHLLERRAFLSDEDRQTLVAILDRLHGRRNAPVWRWEWFGAIEQQISSIASRAAGVLSADAFERNATNELLDLARRISQRDPCDEQAREIAIKAHLAAGRDNEARAEYKHYEAVLARDLAMEPSAYLRNLVLA